MSLHVGDVRDGLRQFIAQGIRAQTCVTSPPYWGLRDYGVPGQLGLEPTIAEYIANMVEVFRLVRDVLADDGTLWLNMGDSYAGGGRGGNPDDSPFRKQATNVGSFVERSPLSGMKPKDLCGIPWRVAFALQADGWYLRSDIIWAKPNPMPESVTDRPTKAHEYLFLLSKQERYYYDAQAIAEPAAYPFDDRGSRTDNRRGTECNSVSGMTGTNRNRRTVWTIATEPYPDAHFATFPTALVEPCIMAGTSERGHCPKCGKGWERVTDGATYYDRALVGSDPQRKYGEREYGRGPKNNLGASISKTVGWQAACDCGLDPVPGIVLDPFIGSGTVAQVAQQLGRRWIGCELNSAYADMIRQRTAQQGLVLAAAD